ncbi:MAG: 50S ribosomal protein L20 [Chlorobi bacterium]|nr:50S ribosomal protein L20 [Chlorobiota bacterium]
MPRATNAPARKQRRKKLFKLTKGYWGRKKNVHKLARNQLEKSLQYAYRDRRNRKREFRRLWILRINAAARQHGMKYSQFIRGLKLNGIDLNRKVLAELAVNNPEAFAKLVEEAKKALSKVS